MWLLWLAPLGGPVFVDASCNSLTGADELGIAGAGTGAPICTGFCTR